MTTNCKRNGWRGRGRTLGFVLPGLTIAAAAATAWLLVPAAAFADSTGDGHYGAHGMWGGGWIGMLFGFLMMAAVIAAIVALVIFVVRVVGGQGRPAGGGGSRAALDVLEARFARGEIDSQEFEERRRLLGEESR